MMAYRSSVHESTGFSPYRLMFGEECTLPMDIGLPRDQLDTLNSIVYGLDNQNTEGTESPVVMVHCQDAKKIPTPLGAVSWLTSKESTLQPSVMILGASTMHRTVPNSLSLTLGLSAEGRSSGRWGCISFVCHNWMLRLRPRT